MRVPLFAPLDMAKGTVSEPRPSHQLPINVLCTISLRILRRSQEISAP